MYTCRREEKRENFGIRVTRKGKQWEVKKGEREGVYDEGINEKRGKGTGKVDRFIYNRQESRRIGCRNYR